MNIKYKVNTLAKQMTSINYKKIALPSWSSRREAFTLIELMVVIGVIGILAGIILAIAGGVQGKAARDEAKAEIQTFCVALEKYRADHGGYPSSRSQQEMTNKLYLALTNYMTFRSNKLSGSGTNIAILDPYGRAYRYRSPAVASTTMLSENFEIFSVGKDGVSTLDNGSGTPGDSKDVDDIKSW